MFPLYDENPRSSRPYINYSLIAVNFIVFIWEVIVTRSIFLNNISSMRLMLEYGFVPARFLASIQEGSLDGILPIFSSMFMHGGIFHILGNMLFLWVFGDNIEDRFGHLKYLLAYLMFGFIAAVSHFAWIIATNDNLMIPAVGASGAVSGVLGAYMMIFPKAKIVTLVFFFFVTTVRIPAFTYLFMWFIYQVILAPFGGGVAYLAHIGGFVGGVALAALYKSLINIKIRQPTKIYYSEAQILKPLRLEGIITSNYVEILAYTPGIDVKSIKVNVIDDILYIEGVTEDRAKKYEGRALLRVKVYEIPESMDYLNGVLKIKFKRI